MMLLITGWQIASGISFVIIVNLFIFLWKVLGAKDALEEKLSKPFTIDHSFLGEHFYPKALFMGKTKDPEVTKYLMEASDDIHTSTRTYEISKKDFDIINEFPLTEKSFILKSRTINPGLDELYFWPVF